MPRPFKNRKIGGCFKTDYYKPQGVPLSMLSEVELTVDEMEAIRLADLESLYQNDAAEKMNVSRQTFGNIVKKARQKIADALINGKAIRVISAGRSYSDSMLRCGKCGLLWKKTRNEQKNCPECESPEQEIPEDAFNQKNFFNCRRGRGKGNGRGRGCS
ncbi:DUF134 domain-containing protein [Lentisphaerota bacterium ZTH]|nr:DUF134 domain-containing protein [Lentisphaerota bacterium]WET05117.1 DUF134 domain-containing protein [Lentisphaerota bacterium ZTH]